MVNIPVPPIQCCDITEQLRAQTLTFSSTLGQGRGKEEKKKEAKKATFPTLLTMIVVFKAAVFLLGLVVSLDLLKADGG